MDQIKEVILLINKSQISIGRNMRQSSPQMEGGHPYLNGSPKAVFFTDFDGTVTLQDCNDYLVITYANNCSQQLTICTG
jgi:hypothetical protein